MKIDFYTKFVLSLIALGIWAMLLTPMLKADKVAASTGVIDVNIKEIGGRTINDDVLRVDIKEINGRTFSGPSLPVSK